MLFIITNNNINGMMPKWATLSIEKESENDTKSEQEKKVREDGIKWTTTRPKKKVYSFFERSAYSLSFTYSTNNLRQESQIYRRRKKKKQPTCHNMLHRICTVPRISLESFRFVGRMCLHYTPVLYFFLAKAIYTYICIFQSHI